MRGAIPLPQYVFMAWCLVKHRENFTFNFSAMQPYWGLEVRVYQQYSEMLGLRGGRGG
jgi:hypothetical protein